MSRGPDAGTLLMRALIADADAAGCPIEIVSADWTRWASATFTGARHELIVAAPENAVLKTWLATLTDADLALRGHLLADLAVIAIRRSDGAAHIILEALTVED